MQSLKKYEMAQKKKIQLKPAKSMAVERSAEWCFTRGIFSG